MEVTCKIINDEVYERHQFDYFILDTLDYIKDGDHPFAAWGQTEKSQWIRNHAKEIEYRSFRDYNTLQVQVVIIGFVTPKRWTEFVLKFT